MKKIIYCILTFSLLLIFGCEKQQAGLPLNERLTGGWEFIKAEGGFTGHQVELPPAGTKTTLIFSSDYKYKRNVNGQTVEQGTYDLTRVTSIFTGELYDAIRFNDFSGPADQLITVKNDSLLITDNHVEPYSYLYLKMK